MKNYKERTDLWVCHNCEYHILGSDHMYFCNFTGELDLDVDWREHCRLENKYTVEPIGTCDNFKEWEYYDYTE